MKRQQAEAALHRFFEESGKAVPSQSEIEPVLDRVWERLEGRADEFVDVRRTAPRPRRFRFAWAVGAVVVAVLVNVVIWRQGSPFSGAVKTGNSDAGSMWKSSSQQARETLQLAVPQNAFELASVKLVEPGSEAFNRAKTGDDFQFRLAGCQGGSMSGVRLDPGRITIPAVTVLTLVIVAYAHDCSLVEGGPAWARSGGEYYEIQGLLPAGTPTPTQQDLQKGNTPLQRMLQNLLADRFQLVLNRQMREMPVYTLTVATPGKMKLSPDETVPPPSFTPPPGFPPPPPVGRGQKYVLSISGEVNLFGHAISMSELAKDLRQHAGRLVVDKTGLTGVFDYNLKFAAQALASPTPQSIPPLPGAPPPVPPVPPVPTSPLSSLSDALEEQLGLKLESTRMPVEILIIESVERPAAN